MGPALLARKPAGRAPGVPLRLARLFHRTIGQAPRAHEVQDAAAQGPAQPGPGRRRPPTAVTVHRTRAGAQERSDHRGVACVGGQEECHLRLVAGREPCGGLGPLFRVEEGVVTLAARRLPVVAGNARRADVHNFRSLPGAACGQRAAWMPEERWSDMGGPALEVAVRFTATSRVRSCAHQPGRARGTPGSPGRESGAGTSLACLREAVTALPPALRGLPRTIQRAGGFPSGCSWIQDRPPRSRRWRVRVTAT